MPLGERIKLLRKERAWSQGELAERVDADARQISRYENDRITPSVEVLVRLAEVFDVSIDYLLVRDSPRRPLRIEGGGLIERLQEIQTLSDADRSSLLHIIDALVTKNKVKSIAENLG